MAMAENSMLDRLEQRAAERGDRPALLEPRSARYDAWDTITWREYADIVRRLARGFIALGLERGDAVTITGPNRPAWVLADLAAMAAGGLPAGIYATATAEQTEYILGHAGASIAVVVDDAQAQKVLALKPRLPKLRAVVLFPGASRPQATQGVYSWEEVLAKGDATPAERLDERRNQTKVKDAAMLIYTSGTTGPPKAVMLSHENLLWTAGAAAKLVQMHPGDGMVSYLPLAHIAEQMLTIHAPLTFAVTVHFVPVLEQLADALRMVRPHAFLGVPRVWEKIQAKVEAGVASAPPAKQRLFRLAQRVGLRVMRQRFEGRHAALVDRVAFEVFDRLIYRKFRERLGLDRARYVATGAAPLSRSTRDWLLSVGLGISEVYGQSEGSGPTSFNEFGKGREGTVGLPVPGVQVKIAPDGEILVRGPNVFLGYLHDEQATRETIIDGWLHSGDVGEIDRDGYVRLTDRKKDLIITAGGKNISPQNIERLLTEIPLVSQAVVIGDQRKYLSALVTLVPEELERFCREAGIMERDPTRLASHPQVRDVVQRAIDQNVNPRLARHETIKRFDILPSELSEGAGELTPTMKIKRKVVSSRYASHIDRLYEGPDASN